MHGHSGGKLLQQGLPTVAKSSAEQLGYRRAEILTAMLQVRFRDCSPIKLQWQPRRGISLPGTAILWDLAGSNFTFDIAPQRGRFSRAFWRDFVDLSFSVVDWTRLYRVMPSAKVPRLVSGVRHWPWSVVYKMNSVGPGMLPWGPQLLF